MGKKDIEIANIPSFIEIIHERAFHTHLKLKQVNIPDDSKLREINSLAFAVCNELEKINIPPSLIKVGKDAFFQCNKLQIEMPDNSELSIIEENAFGNANFETFVISSKLSNEFNNFIENIQYSEIFLCPNPNYTLYNDDEYMLAKSSPEKENFDVLLLVANISRTARIPLYIENIEKYAFFEIMMLSKLIFQLIQGFK